MLGILVGGLFTFLFGGMILMLFFGARRIEEELQQRAQEARRIRADAASIPRFFMVTPQPAPGVGRLDEALLSQLQQYVDAEQVLADEFVLQPSIENLYRDSSTRLAGH